MQKTVKLTKIINGKYWISRATAVPVPVNAKKQAKKVGKINNHANPKTAIITMAEIHIHDALAITYNLPISSR